MQALEWEVEEGFQCSLWEPNVPSESPGGEGNLG